MEAKYMTTPDDGSDPREVQTGEVGELYLRGPNIFLGYHKNPSATADSISKDGWFRTGDVGYQDFKGNFFITDRVKELIEYKGFQVAPAELRGILVGHAAVNDVAVIQLTSKMDVRKVVILTVCVTLGLNTDLYPTEIARLESSREIYPTFSPFQGFREISKRTMLASTLGALLDMCIFHGWGAIASPT
ncbi:putative long-chain-fatty-acid CoA ligase [Aspergillus flavus AF70]|nr:putative long-chain-fatty-acid CoA ligase [Aspergillus flavus AF70]